MIGKCLAVAAGLVIILSSCSHDASKDSARIVSSIHEDWKFAKDLPDSATYEQPDFDDTGWDLVSIPHTPRLEPLVVNDQWRGNAWYRKALSVPETFRGRKIFVRFEGAMQNAEVWMNGHFLGEHKGGYLPFAFDLTDRVNFGRPNTLAVKLNNEDDPTVPPGKPLATLDFNYFGGIYRNVALIVTNRVFMTDPILADLPGGGGVYTYATDVSDEKATLHVYVHVQNDGEGISSTSVRLTLRDADAQAVLSELMAQDGDDFPIPAGQSHTFSGSYRVATPLLWSPESPNLYDLTTEVLQSGRPVDSVTTRIGVREFQMSATSGFQINGRRIFLRGTNRHQEYPYVGYAAPDEAHYRDAVRIKNAGFDKVRLSHYPHAEAFMRAADELGIVLMDAIPGWQFFGDEIFQDRALADVRMMARRDRNHPSVAFWEVSLNESGMDTAFMQRANETLRDELPGQNVFTAGWIDDESYDLFIPARQHSRPPEYWSEYDRGERPIFIAEYGDWEYYAQNAGFNQTEFRDLADDERTSRQLRSAGEIRLLQQALNYQEAANSNRKGGATIGHANWLMFDYNRGYADDIEASGISDILRLPKFAYYFYRSQRSHDVPVAAPAVGGPVIFIANYWQPGSSTNVRVFGNAGEVELHLNGESIGRQAPDNNPNTTHLNHPPFTFSLPRFESGTLRAIGYIGGEPVAEDVVSTPGSPTSLNLQIDYAGVPVSSEQSDLLFVYAHIVDENGNPIPGDTSEVEFAIDGPGALVGPKLVRAEAGIATALIRTDPSNVVITVEAESHGLHSASATVQR